MNFPGSMRGLGQGLAQGAANFMNRPRPQMPGPMQGPMPSPMAQRPLPGMGAPQGPGVPNEAIMRERVRRQPQPRLY